MLGSLHFARHSRADAKLQPDLADNPGRLRGIRLRDIDLQQIPLLQSVRDIKGGVRNLFNR